MLHGINDVVATADRIVSVLDGDSEQIFQRLLRIKNKLETYNSLRRDLLSTNVEIDLDYQRRYNGFYQVRRPETWRAKYYGLLQRWKRRKNVRFAEVIRELHDLTGCVEPSFSSKLVATIRPEAPVYDAKVRRHMRVRVPPRAMAPQDRMTKLIAEYQRITEVARTAVNTDKFQKLRVIFNERFPDYMAFAETKKLDLMLWQS